jgi:hypothetical protein
MYFNVNISNVYKFRNSIRCVNHVKNLDLTHEANKYVVKFNITYCMAQSGHSSFQLVPIKENKRVNHQYSAMVIYIYIYMNILSNNKYINGIRIDLHENANVAVTLHMNE